MYHACNQRAGISDRLLGCFGSSSIGRRILAATGFKSRHRVAIQPCLGRTLPALLPECHAHVDKFHHSIRRLYRRFAIRFILLITFVVWREERGKKYVPDQVVTWYLFDFVAEIAAKSVILGPVRGV